MLSARADDWAGRLARLALDIRRTLDEAERTAEALNEDPTATTEDGD